MKNEKNGAVPGSELRGRLEQCRQAIKECGRAVVAFSGGVDSTLLLAVAVDVLGPDNVLAVVGVSPSLPQDERRAARELAAALGAQLVEVMTCELNDPNYAANPAERCYFCKHELFSRLQAVASERNFAALLSGANADDAGDFRPGLRAGDELGVRNPLMEAGLTKVDIRQVSAAMGLPTAEKPAMACLASRLPYGQPITAERLGRVEQAEGALRKLGFLELRVRDHDTVARIEVAADDMASLLALRSDAVAALKRCGYTYVSLDLAGFRSGSGNDVLKGRP